MQWLNYLTVEPIARRIASATEPTRTSSRHCRIAAAIRSSPAEPTEQVFKVFTNNSWVFNLIYPYEVKRSREKIASSLSIFCSLATLSDVTKVNSRSILHIQSI